MKTVILTDSTSDLTVDQARQMDIEMIPLIVSFSGKSYADGVDLTKEQFYKMQAESEELPVTSQPNPEEFLKVFEKHKALGNEIIYIGISSVLSGTHQSATIAKEMAEYPHIYLVDTQSAAFGVEACVRAACQMRNTGANASQIAQFLNEKKEKLRIFAAVDTLKYLIKGGRISKAAGAIGGVLNLKPIITVEKGALVSIGKARGQQGAFDFIVNLVQQCNVDETMPIIITHSNDSQTREKFVQHLKKANICYDWSYGEVGSVIGTHVGPKCVGIAFFEK